MAYTGKAPFSIQSGGTARGTLTNNAVLVGAGTNPVTQVTPAANGVLISSNTDVPSWLANSGTPGYILTANSGAPPSWQSASASGAITTIDGDSGSVTPTAGVVTFTGSTTGLTFSGAVSTMTLGGTLALANGGTNANLTANNGGIFYSTASAGAILAGTATARQMLQSGASTTPAWSTTTWPATSTINQLLYSSAASVISGLATANNGTLVTSATGVPSILAGPGTTGNIFQSNAAAAPSFSTATYPSVGTSTGSLLRADGTNWVATTSTYPNTNAINTLLYASAANVMSALATGNNGVLITSASGVPSWLADGTTGQVLTATTGSPPTWAAASFTKTAPTIQQFTSGSGAYTTPTTPAPLYIRVVLVGPGGGGSAQGTNNGSNGSAATTFGTSLLSGGAGLGGNVGGGGTGAGGVGGTASLGAAIGVAINGADGQGVNPSVDTYGAGGQGGSSALGGGGAGSVQSAAGGNAKTNSGSGGGGAGGAAGAESGSGGGAGGYVDAIITSLSATYSYVVGSGGNGGAAGGVKGGNGAAGIITVYEYYQ